MIQRKCLNRECRRSVPQGIRACLSCGQRGASYIARYRGLDGVEHSQSFTRRIDAERFLADQETKKARREWIDPKLGAETLASYYGRWVARAQATGKPTERTLIAYDEVWRLYVAPILGSRRLGSLTRADCQAVVDRASSPWRALDVRKVMSSILGSAGRDELIVRNPAASLAVPRIEQEEPRVLTVAEVERLADAIDDPYRALVLLGAYSSLRWSELVGLQVASVDFLRRRVRVERKIVEAGKLITGEPKTRRSKRWVTVPEFVVRALAEHVRPRDTSSPAEPNVDGLLFPGPDGGPLRRKTFRRAWVKATKAANLPGFRFRNLRHTGATWALQAGVSPVLVAFRLGHASTRMIEQHYGALIESMDAEIAERLGDARAAEAGPMRDHGGTGTSRRSGGISESGR